jgi:LysM repeat protein
MKKRFLVKVTFATIILTMTLVIFVNTSKVSGSSKENFKIVSVQKGDTLWSIVKDNCGNYKDIRKAIYYIKEANDIRTADITPGQQIKIPSKLLK